MKTFTITQRDGTEHTVFIDNEDYDDVMKYSWHIIKSKNAFYARKNKHIGIINGKQKQTKTFLHRFILDITNPKIFIDHINHNGLDNRKENLRIVTSEQNQYNRKPNKIMRGKTPTSKYKGVAWHKLENKWISNIQINGNRKYLGYFIHEYEAHLAYKKAAEKYQGEYKYEK